MTRAKELLEIYDRQKGAEQSVQARSGLHAYLHDDMQGAWLDMQGAWLDMQGAWLACRMRAKPFRNLCPPKQQKIMC